MGQADDGMPDHGGPMQAYNPYAGYPAPWMCGGVDAPLVPSPAPALALGAQCGPLALKQILGFEDVEIQGCSSAVVEAEPLVFFKVSRLFIPSTIGAQVVIEELTIMNQRQFVGCKGSISGLAFSENAEDICLNTNTAVPGTPICLRVRNITKSPVCFIGAGLIGFALDGGYPHLFGSFGTGC